MRFLLLFIALVNLFSQELLSEKVLSEISVLSKELEQKTGIKTSVLVKNKISLKDIQNNLQTNYAILAISLDDKKLDVINDLGFNFNSVTKYYYLKYGFLPTQGAVLPILTQKKGEDLLNASVLNGFAELCDVIAKEKGVVLDNAFGNTNDNLISSIRLAFYSFIVFVIYILLRRKLRKNRE